MISNAKTAFPRGGCFAGWILLFGLLLAALAAPAAEWQWSQSVDSMTIGGSQDHPRAFLWIPPDCRRVRAIVFGQNNMIEEGILQDPGFRKTMGKLGIAELFVAPVFDLWQVAGSNDTANVEFDALLQNFADESGYGELKFAPIIPIGHSAMASFPWNFAVWNPGRTLAVLSVHGDAPQTKLTGNGRPNLDWDGRDLHGIPGLMVMGEYEWWINRITSAFAYHVAHPDDPLAVICDAGHGHFDYSDDLVRFLEMFIRKAAGQRLPKGAPLDAAVPLKPIDARDGWLMDCYRRYELPRAQAAPYAKYTGDRSQAFWCWDKEMAQAVENYNPQYGKQPQLAGYIQDGKIVDQTTNAHAQILLKVPPLDDSLTFKLSGTFLNTVPPGSRPAMWTGLTNGAPLTHATNHGPIKLSRITGPVEQIDAQTFAIRFNRFSLMADRRMGDIWLLASHPGDSKYKSAVQQSLMQIPFRLKTGLPQTITFPPIPDQSLSHGLQKFRIRSEISNFFPTNPISNSPAKTLPIYYYIREGPAEIHGDELTFTKIPPRAKLPIRVTVVAWQYGRTTEPAVASAEPVTRSFLITP